ncbi:hypothetical protein KUCAC02_032597 [Chaenocephalus aceratus]|nr:hypothetical protein KUCAC02_032597 [Chaenocephalus aceratus]
MIIAQRTAPHRPSSRLEVIEALLQVHISIIHVLWTIPTGANPGEVSCPRTQRPDAVAAGAGFELEFPSTPP